MLLSARILNNALGVNNFDYAEAAQFTEGDTPSITFQLLDLTQDKAADGFNPAGRRFMPAAGATLMVTLDALDEAKKVVRSASQPFAQDPSIWRINILTTDVIRGTITMRLALTQGGVVTRGSVPAAVLVSPAR